MPSALLYAAVQFWHINLPGYPEDTEWFFNPFAWQFLFVIAAVFGFATVPRQAPAGRARPPRPFPPWIVAPAIAVALAGALFMGSDMLHDQFGLPLLWNIPLWIVDKTPLPPMRLASVLALAVLVARFIPREAGFLTSRPAWLLVLCGRSSLEIFGLTILLSVLATTLMTLVGRTLAVQLAINFAGIAVMLGTGLVMAWYGGGGKLPTRPGNRRSTTALASLHPASPP